MNHAPDLRTSTTGRTARWTALATGIALAVLCGAVAAHPIETTDETPVPEAATEHPHHADGTGTEPEDPSRRWGIEITSIRLTANDHMIDFRYRVVDSARAAELFVRQNKPKLVHHETGMVLSVPETAKVGPLRNSNTPKEGKIYWMFFGNAGKLVKPGDTVTVTIGDFRAENLIIE